MAEQQQNNRDDLKDMASQWYGSGATKAPGFLMMKALQNMQSKKMFNKTLKSHEGFRSKPYVMSKDKDAHKKIATIGYGTRNNNITNTALRALNIDPKSVWSGQRSINPTEAESLMNAHVKYTADKFEKHYGSNQWNKIPSRMKNSLVNMGYQMGAHNVLKKFPSMVSAIGRGDGQRAYDESLYSVGNPNSPRYRNKKSDWNSQTPNRARAVSAGYLEPEVSPMRNSMSLQQSSPKPRWVK